MVESDLPSRGEGGKEAPEQPIDEAPKQPIDEAPEEKGEEEGVSEELVIRVVEEGEESEDEGHEEEGLTVVEGMGEVVRGSIVNGSTLLSRSASSVPGGLGSSGWTVGLGSLEEEDEEEEDEVVVAVLGLGDLEEEEDEDGEEIGDLEDIITEADVLLNLLEDAVEEDNEWFKRKLEELQTRLDKLEDGDMDKKEETELFSPRTRQDSCLNL